MNSNKWYRLGFFAILTLPLITTPLLFSPTAWGKGIILRIIISILLFLSVLNFDYYRHRVKEIIKNKARIPFLLLIVLLILAILATLFSLDPNFSFWGSPLRGDGSLNYILCIFFALLAFLTLKKEDWPKLLKFSIFIGFLVSLVALAQKLGFFSDIILTYNGRPPGTLGGPIFLALYLLLLIFLTAALALKEKKRWPYLVALILFIYILLSTGSRAGYFGLLIGSIYFILILPIKKKLVTRLKIAFLIFLILAGLGLVYINTDRSLVSRISDRLSFQLALDDPRFSAWNISTEAIFDRPLFGFGPENFSIAFDRHYDPSLPFISQEWGSWYDRAHSFIFELATTYGLPFLLVFIALLATLFLKLRKIRQKNLIIHALLATILAYLAANLFSFDVVSTYIVFFFLVAYGLSFLAEDTEFRPEPKDYHPFRATVVGILFLGLIVFIYFGAIKPLVINGQINKAERLTKMNNCQKALDLAAKKVLNTQSSIDSYLKLKYISLVEFCRPNNKLAPKILSEAIRQLEDSARLRPYYTRSWVFLGNYVGQKEPLEKAKELSPKREEIYIGQANIDFYNENYKSADRIATRCTEINPYSLNCWWLKALTSFYTDNIFEAGTALDTAVSYGYNFHPNLDLIEKACEYTKTANCYNELINIYTEIIEYEKIEDKENNYSYYHTRLKELAKQTGRQTEINNYLVEIEKDIEVKYEDIKNGFQIENKDYLLILANRINKLKEAEEFLNQ